MIEWDWSADFSSPLGGTSPFLIEASQKHAEAVDGCFFSSLISPFFGRLLWGSCCKDANVLFLPASLSSGGRAQGTAQARRGCCGRKIFLSCLGTRKRLAGIMKFQLEF